ncbi:MAG TPA: V-type ATP synthase subunit D [Acholeplasma sp.]|jgi:V/A-type H+-transporting ATPase subunit D
MADVVNATRMELSKLKNQRVTTQRGHHLLKDKQDEMMRQFLAQIQSYKALRQEVESMWLSSLDAFNDAKTHHYDAELREKFQVPSTTLKLSFEKQAVMSIFVPKIKILEQSKPKLTYSFHGSYPVVDDIVMSLSKMLPKLIELAYEDKKNRILIAEIEKTKRRVNAIEHIILPEIEEKIKTVRMKISDAERSNTVRIMKSKDLILKKNQKEKTQ